MLAFAGLPAAPAVPRSAPATVAVTHASVRQPPAPRAALASRTPRSFLGARPGFFSGSVAFERQLALRRDQQPSRIAAHASASLEDMQARLAASTIMKTGRPALDDEIAKFVVAALKDDDALIAAAKELRKVAVAAEDSYMVGQVLCRAARVIAHELQLIERAEAVVYKGAPAAEFAASPQLIMPIISFFVARDDFDKWAKAYAFYAESASAEAAGTAAMEAAKASSGERGIVRPLSEPFEPLQSKVAAGLCMRREFATARAALPPNSRQYGWCCLYAIGNLLVLALGGGSHVGEILNPAYPITPKDVPGRLRPIVQEFASVEELGSTRCNMVRPAQRPRPAPPHPTRPARPAPPSAPPRLAIKQAPPAPPRPPHPTPPRPAPPSAPPRLAIKQAPPAPARPAPPRPRLQDSEEG
eukprot:tig00021434_g21377.t1